MIKKCRISGVPKLLMNLAEYPHEIGLTIGGDGRNFLINFSNICLQYFKSYNPYKKLQSFNKNILENLLISLILYHIYIMTTNIIGLCSNPLRLDLNFPSRTIMDAF